MAKRLVALFDTDLEYVNRFMAYVKEKRNLPFKMAGFSELKPLLEFLERNRTDVLLLSGDKEKDSSLAEIKKIRGMGKIIILGDAEDRGHDRIVINKYQSAEAIISGILGSMDVFESDDGVSEASGPEIIGIYSPAGGQKKQIFSLCLANALAKSKSVLYISLERFSGLKSLAGMSKDASLSDLIYFYKTNTEKIREGLSSSVQTVGNFHCLTAPLDYEDIDVVGDENWHEFLGILAAAGGYECVVIDIDEAIKKICSFFDICRRIYVPVTKGRWAEKRTEEFKEYIRLCEKEKLFEKITEINMGEAEITGNVPDEPEGNYLQYCFLGKIQAIAENAVYKGA